jgi:hypothetical protein
MVDKSQPVLIVDDSRTMCAVISKIANQIGFKDVDAVYTGLDALAQLRKRTYGLIIAEPSRELNASARAQNSRATRRKSCDPLIKSKRVIKVQGLMHPLVSIIECLPGQALQSNPVSGLFLQKTATLRKLRGDFRHSGSRKYQFWDPEIFQLTQEARQRRPF